MIKQFKIDPWTCVPALALVEFMKMTENNASDATELYDVTTVNGFQPTIDNPIEWPQLGSLRSQVHAFLNNTLDYEWEIFRSWFVSYNEGGSQRTHSHEPAKHSMVISLMDSPNNGLLEFDNGQIYDMIQGDGVLFPSTMKHRGCTVFYPKTIIALDIKEIDQ